GFGQSSANTWGKFLGFVAEEPKLSRWDIFTLSYKNPQPWQITSMFQQAILVTEYLDNEAAADRLRGVFREVGS
ncbi:MAG: hypothetical protein AAF657_27715, partial [Acidobacteriota bacterium]